SSFSTVDVVADAGDMLAGEQRGCLQDNFEKVWELTNNLELALGSHQLTLGTHDELVHIFDVDGNSLDPGSWVFLSLDSLEQKVPFAYERNVPGPLVPTGGRPDFQVTQVGFYLQDQWIPSSRLTVTGGLRFDVPFLPSSPPENPQLLSELGINSARTPD